VTRYRTGPTAFDATFDDPDLVANTGLVLAATLTRRLGLEALIDATVKLIGRVGAARPGRNIDVGPRDDRRRLAHRSRRHAPWRLDHTGVGSSGDGPSTLRTFLHAFTFRHVRQLEAVVGRVLERPGTSVPDLARGR
jgi:hypothetical protein